MSDQIIGLQDWFQTAPGRYLLDWERQQFDRAVADIFGYHALQLGLPALDALQANRMPHRWLAASEPATLQLAGTETPAAPVQPPVALVTDFAALPFAASSLDLVVLPHTLEFNVDPHATLREVERVLVPEGRVVICGLNPASLWGLRQRHAHLCQHLGLGGAFMPEAGELIGYRRLRDWLRLLSFEVEAGRFGCYLPTVRRDKWLRRLEWVDKAGGRWWPIFGAVYFLVAVKRVRGMRLLGPAWKTAASRAAPVSIASRTSENKARTRHGP